MASSQQLGMGIPLGSACGEVGYLSGSRVLDLSTPAARNDGDSFADEAICKRLHEAGFDEESIKRRDKAALIAYIAILEAEVFNYQHHMGLLLLERNEWASKCKKSKTSAEEAEIKNKCEKVAHSTALAEARKREENLKKALEVEKECKINIEKTLHEIRAESAELKVAAESKIADAESMTKDAQKEYTEAEMKLRFAESFRAEASQYHRDAERKLQEVEAREDELRRFTSSFNSDCDAKEKEIRLERQLLSERQRVLQQGQDQLLEGQALLSQREEYIFQRLQQLNCCEKEIEILKENFEKKCKEFNEEKLSFDLKVTALLKREEATIEREALLNKKDKELLVLQEKLASKEYDEIQRFSVKNEIVLEKRKSAFEVELEVQRKKMEDEIETKRWGYELRVVDLSQKEELIQEKEHDLEVQLRALVEKEQDVAERSMLLEEKQKGCIEAEKDVELEKIHLEKEREEISKMSLDLQKSMNSLENRRKQVEQEHNNLEAKKCERDELPILEMKLKEEIDCIRAQKLQLMSEADELKAEKAKFETEWEMIEEKRQELQREAEHFSKERKVISEVLKEERSSLKLEKDAFQDQLKNDVESLSREQEDFITKMESEHSEWFRKTQQERADFLLDIEMQKKELECCIDRRKDEIENYLREKEEAFEQEKARELRHINSLKEMVTKEWEDITLEMKRLDHERRELKLDWEQREKEWAEINNAIEELHKQKGKLQKQRQLLHADREAINIQIQHLEKLEDLKIEPENVLSKIQHGDPKYSRRRFPAKKCLNMPGTSQFTKQVSHPPKEAICDTSKLELLSKQGAYNDSPHSSTPLSWLKRCAELIFRQSPEKTAVKHGEGISISEFEDANLKLQERKYSQNTKKILSTQFVDVEGLKSRENDSTEERRNRTMVLAVGKDGRGPHNLASECGTETAENFVYSVAKADRLAGKKRPQVAFSCEQFEGESKQLEDNKKQKQQNFATETLSATSTTPLSPDENNNIERSEEQFKEISKVCLEDQAPQFEEDNIHSG